jgi:hypothetical protein
MPPDDPNSHTASIHIDVAPERAFEFMASGMEQTHWALGSWNRREVGDGVFTGKSLFDGRQLFIRLESSREHLLVDYYTGPSPQELRRAVMARIMPGEYLGRDPNSCVLALTTFRSDRVSPEAWARTYHAFKTEVHLIKGRLEGAGD